MPPGEHVVRYDNDEEEEEEEEEGEEEGGESSEEEGDGEVDVARILGNDDPEAVFEEVARSGQRGAFGRPGLAVLF